MALPNKLFPHPIVEFDGDETSEGGIDDPVRAGLLDIANDIARMKAEIGRLRPGEIRQSHIPDVGRELDAIVEATEGATHQIMETAEVIMEAEIADAAAYKDFVNGKMTEIFEACTFQDITGQRISRVVETLQLIDRRVSNFVEQLELHDLLDSSTSAADEKETESDRRKRDLILNGPQDDGDGVSQDDVDALFGNDSSQSDIDKLFD